MGSGRIQSDEGKADETLALFSAIRSQQHRSFLNHPSLDGIEASLSSRIGDLTHLANSSLSKPPWKIDDLLATGPEKNEYNWLLTPPATPLFPSLDMESPKVHVQRNHLQQSQSTLSVSKLSRLVAGEIYNSNQNKIPGSSTAPSTISRKIFPTEKKMATPTRQMSMEHTNARPRHLATLSFRSSSTEKYASPKRRGSLSPGPQALQKQENELMAEEPPNLSITRTNRTRLHSKGATLQSRRGDELVLETCNVLSAGSRMSSSTFNQDCSSRKESILSLTHNHRDHAVPISTQRDNRIVGERLASAISNQLRHLKGTSTKGLGSAWNSGEQSTPSKIPLQDIDCHSKDMIQQPIPSDAPLMALQDVKPRGTRYKTTRPFSTPSIGTTRMVSSEKGEKLMSNYKSIDKGERESEDKWEAKNASKANAEMNKKHMIRHVCKDQIKGKDTFRDQNTCKRSNFAANAKNTQTSQKKCVVTAPAPDVNAALCQTRLL